MIANLGTRKSLSPRELARAVGVSESSVKRWIDAGRIPARLTSGGHRRIDWIPALRFVRESGRGLADASLLGLSPDPTIADPELLSDRVFELLVEGKSAELSRMLVTALTTRAMDPAALIDGPLRAAMSRIGLLWEQSSGGIYVEHRATQMLLRILDQIDALCDPPADEIIAVGGSIDGDPSSLPTRMAATVLASEGIYPVNLGADTPASAFLEAADQIGAHLVWISVSYVSDVERQSREIARLIDELERRGIATILGGREVHRLDTSARAKAQVGRTMDELASMARVLRATMIALPGATTGTGLS